MEYKTTNKKINLEQFAEETGIDISRLGVKTKGDEMIFFSDTLTQTDINKIANKIKDHVAQPKPKEPNQQLIDFFNLCKTHTKDGEMITDTELNKIAEGFKLI